MSVPLISDRASYSEPTPIEHRVFHVADFATAFESVRPTRMYTGDAFRAGVFRLSPGQAQEPHMHPSTTHAWFVVSGTGELTLDDGATESVGEGSFCVHPVLHAHGLKNVGADDLVYVSLSIERAYASGVLA